MPIGNLDNANKRNQAQFLDSLNNFGLEPGGVMSQEQLSAAEQAAGDFIDRVKENLQAGDHMVTGETANIQIRHVDDGIEITCNPSLIYLDRGVNGRDNKTHNDLPGYTDTPPPIAPFIEWVRIRGLDISPYAVRWNVFKNGIAPTQVYSREIPKLMEDVRETVVGLTVQKLIQILRQNQ